MNRPKVSVCVVTYNQAKYIRQCLQSLVTQETDFSFEIIVGDDASTDGTTELIQEYVNQYPNLVKAIFHQENGGPTQNYFSVHHLAQGEYIAHVDGDDYALPGKLQIQADFLDKNPDCDIVAHTMKLIDFSGNELQASYKRYPLKNDLNYLLYHQTFFNHSSKMHRLKNHCKPQEFLNDEVIDFSMHIYHALNGHIGYLNQKLGAYRLGVGITSNNNTYLYRLLLTKKSFIYALYWGLDERNVKKAYFRFLSRTIYGTTLNNIKIEIDNQLIDKSLLLSRHFVMLKSLIKFKNLFPQTFFILCGRFNRFKKLAYDRCRTIMTPIM